MGAALLLCVGLGLLVAGGRGLVSGASRLAAALGVSELAIGLTVVAFGTSAPELGVNVLAALRGDAGIAFGNVVGSNIANIALVLGFCVLLRPLRIESVIVFREIPMMLLATAAALVLGFDRFRGTGEVYDRSDGLILLLLFSIFLYYTVSEVVAKRRTDPLAEVATRGLETRDGWTTGRAGLLACAGLCVLLAGAELTVSQAVALAEMLGVSRAVIGLTIVAVGTSLPELATSLVATWRGQTNLAIGNVIGSNIFNLLFILGVTAVLRSVELPAGGGAADLLALAAFSAVMVPLSRTQGSRILPWHGAGLVLAYLAYMIWRITA
jgi:cation:H+ antiporter